MMIFEGMLQRPNAFSESPAGDLAELDEWDGFERGAGAKVRRKPRRAKTSKHSFRTLDAVDLHLALEIYSSLGVIKANQTENALPVC